MNKKVLIALLMSFFVATNVFTETCRIVFVQANGDRIEENIDSEATSIVLYSGEGKSGEILNVEGLELLKKLENIEIQSFQYRGNYDFLKELKQIKNLWITSTHISSLKFLEDMENLEEIYVDCYDMTEKEYERFKNERINLKKLNKLKKISFTGSYCSEKNNSQSYLKMVPKFYNVKNRTEIVLYSNGIETVSEEDISLLEQYSKIYLEFNPIIENAFEMSKLKELNIE